MPNPILREVLQQFETDRLLIRCPHAGDGPTVHASIVESLSELREFPASLPWAMAEPSVEASEQFCRESHANYLLRISLPMLLFLKGMHTHVGCSGLHALEWSRLRAARRGFGHEGLITEAVKGITAFAFTQL